jgi:hypothetical protein
LQNYFCLTPIYKVFYSQISKAAIIIYKGVGIDILNFISDDKNIDESENDTIEDEMVDSNNKKIIA